jgi:hypothetical protein
MVKNVAQSQPMGVLVARNQEIKELRKSEKENN